MAKSRKSDILKTTTVVIMRLLQGLSFTTLGFTLSINPVAGAQKLEMIMETIGMIFFAPASLILVIAAGAMEFSIGVNMLLGTNFKSTTIKSIIFLTALLPFSIYLAYGDQAYESGVYNDLLFRDYNNLWIIQAISLIFSILIVVWNKHNIRIYSSRTEWFISIYSVAFASFLSIYCYVNLPIFNIGTYTTGTDIRKYASSKAINNRIQGNDTIKFCNFEEEIVPARDGMWTRGIKLYDPTEGDVTNKILDAEGYTFLLITEDLTKTSTGKRREINTLFEYSKKNGYNFYCLTSTPVGSTLAEEYIVESGGAEYKLINGSQQVLREMIRSNPGLILLKDGVIQNKWSNYNIPTFVQRLEESPKAQLEEKSDKIQLLKVVLLFGFALIVLLVVDWVLRLCRWLWLKSRRKSKSRKNKPNQDSATTDTKKTEAVNKADNHHIESQQADKNKVKDKMAGNNGSRKKKKKN